MSVSTYLCYSLYFICFLWFSLWNRLWLWKHAKLNLLLALYKVEQLTAEVKRKASLEYNLKLHKAFMSPLGNPLQHSINTMWHAVTKVLLSNWSNKQRACRKITLSGIHMIVNYSSFYMQPVNSATITHHLCDLISVNLKWPVWLLSLLEIPQH